MADANSTRRAHNFIDRTGKRFNNLTVLEHAGGRMWRCQCDCGRTTVVDHGSLGRVKTCGCGRRKHLPPDAPVCHHMAKTRVYSIWLHIHRRCNGNTPSGRRFYSSRGITVCERWHSFDLFYADVGDPPTPQHSLDRYPDNNGNYEPGNCRWATMKEQCRNTRRNVLIAYQGETRCISEWAEITGMARDLIAARFRRGWQPEKIFATPPRKLNRRR